MDRTDANRRVRGLAALLAVVASALVGLLAAAPAHATTSTALVGTFRVTAGSCSGGAVSGSYIRMILPSGGATGPYMSNSDSTCTDASYTLLRPGASGGLISGSYQPAPAPIFDAKGNARADSITAPAVFYGTGFATATTSKDPQTGRSVPAPSITAHGSTLTGDLRSFAVTWNNQYFNQGAPKPDGTYPGNSHAVTGTYNAATGAYTLDWRSQVVGGPFDKFTGAWHLTGTFVPSHGSSGRSPAASTPAAHPTSGAAAPGVSVSTVAAASGTASGVVIAPASGSATSASAASGGAGNSAPISAREVVKASTSVSHGWRAPEWLIILVAIVAVAALYVLVSVQRAISKLGRST